MAKQPGETVLQKAQRLRSADILVHFKPSTRIRPFYKCDTLRKMLSQLFVANNLMFDAESRVLNVQVGEKHLQIATEEDFATLLCALEGWDDDVFVN